MTLCGGMTSGGRRVCIASKTVGRVPNAPKADEKHDITNGRNPTHTQKNAPDVTSGAL